MDLVNRTAIITGGGKGLGSAIARRLAQEGANIVIVSRTQSEVTRVGAEIRALGRGVLAMVADVSMFDDVCRVVHETVDTFSGIDILVNNAAVLGPVGPLVGNDVAQWLHAIQVNLVGTFLCCRAVLPFMIKQKHGKIINLSGGGATSSRPNFTAYSASKCAVVRLTETLADEVFKYNIQVNAIAPGAMPTNLIHQVLEAGAIAGEKALNEAREVLNKGGTSVDRPADLAVFLASSASDKLTGRLISAVYDEWEDIPYRLSEIMSSDLFTLRRIK